MSNNLAIPPYGSILRTKIANNDIPTNDVYLFVGNKSWQTAKDWQLQRPGSLVLPLNKSPFEYEWPVNGCDILICDTSESMQHIIEDLVVCLYSFGAKIVRFISHDYKLTIFKKDF